MTTASVRRLLGLAALAAVLALGVRWFALARLPALARPAAEALAPLSGVHPVWAAASGSSVPVADALVPATTTSSSVPTPRLSAAKQAPQAARPVGSSVAASGIVVTPVELDEALKTRLGGATTRPIRDDAGRVVGLSLHGVSRLARFGVAEGDRLVSANGLSLRTPDEALAALGALQHEKRVTFVLARGTARYAVTVVLGA